MLTVKELAKRLRCSTPKAYELVNQEGFPTLRLGRKILIPEAALEKWIEENTTGNTTEQ